MKYKLYGRKRNNVLNVVRAMSAMRHCFGPGEFERIMRHFRQNTRMSMWDWLYGLDNTKPNIANVFSIAFNWSRSKQGHMYWHRISEKWYYWYWYGNNKR